MAKKGTKNFAELRPEKQAAVRELGLGQRVAKKLRKQQVKTPEEALSCLQQSARQYLQGKPKSATKA